MDYTYNIIDPNATSSLQLQLILKDYGDFSCASTTRDAQDGLNHILKFLPDLVLVHINHDTAQCFRMVSELHQFLSEIPLFVGFSKSKEYAYEALKSGFFDYWILPHDEFEIRKTLLKLRKLKPIENAPTTICLKSYRDYRYLNTNEILYLKADNNATDFFMKDGSKISAFKTLKHFEGQLPQNFMRIHQSYILNTDYVTRINYGKSHCTLKVSDQKLPFSKSYLESVDTLKKMLSKSTVQLPK